MVWALAAFGLVFGFGAREVRRFESLAAEDIASKLEGPSKKVRVRGELNGIVGGALGDLKRVTITAEDFSTEALPLFCEPGLSTKGKVRTLHIALDRFLLAGLRVEHLEADIPDCRFDYGLAVKKRKIRLSRSGLGIGRVKLLERDLEAYLLKKYREIKRISVRVDNNRVYVSGFGQFVVIETEFEVIAKLIPVDGTKLVLADAKVFFGDQVADEAVKELVLNTLNPVVDLDVDLKLFGAVQVEGLELQDGILEAWGKTKIPDRPETIPPLAAYLENRLRSFSKAPTTLSAGMDAIRQSSIRTISYLSP